MLLQCALYYHPIHMKLEQRTARLTILIDPRKKTVFERLCLEEDATPSQVVRRLIRRYIEERTGQPWSPETYSGEPGVQPPRPAARLTPPQRRRRSGV